MANSTTKEIEKDVKERLFMYLFDHTCDPESIEIGKIWTFFKSKEGQRLKLKNRDLVEYEYLHETVPTDIKLEKYFRKPNPKWISWLIGE